MNIECKDKKAQKLVVRLRQIRHNIMLTNTITRNELKSINKEITSIETENYKLVITEEYYPFLEVQTCIDITRVALLDKLSEII